MNHFGIRIGFGVRGAHRCLFALAVAGGLMVVLLPGCGPNYEYFRRLGQMESLEGNYGPARHFFQEADGKSRRRPDNLHDMGVCSVMLAKQRFAQMNHAAAMREVDAAIGYYTAAIDECPGHQASIVGKNIALELKGQFAEALRHAEWAVEFVGPSAKQYLFLAEELDQRGDKDGALVRYRQAVAIEPKNAAAHVAFGMFLLRCENEPAAIEHLQTAHRLDPTDPWVVELLSSRGVLPAVTTKSRAAP